VDFRWLLVIGFKHHGVLLPDGGEMKGGDREMARIKSWDNFQHYKTGPHAAKPPEWIKLYHRLLDDIDWHKLPGEDAKMLVNLWLLASENGGALPSIDVIAFRLRSPEKQVKSILNRLQHWIEDASRQPLEPVYTVSSLEEEEEIEEEVEGEERERRSRAPSPSKKGFQLRKDWHPSENHFLAGHVLGFSADEVDDMAEDMRLWAGSKGEVKKNWDMAFSGWMRREQKSPNGRGPPRVPVKEAHFRRVVQEFLEETDRGNIVEFESRRGLCGPNSVGNSRELHAATPGHENHAEIVEGAFSREAENGPSPDD
jgi:hypothetical protein